VLAKDGNFRDLMTQDRQFRVPLYQRHYKWNRANQETLWRDVLEQYTALAEGGSSIPEHFIGSIVAVELPADPLRDFRHFRIVDGQQRIITLSVAFAALRDVAAQADESQRARLNGKYLVNGTEEQGSEFWARLVPGDEDASAYWTILTDPDAADGHTPIGAAYRFFHSEIEAMRESESLTPETLATALGSRLSLVFVAVGQDERPHKIFESINATGVALTEGDLLRNYLFMNLGSRTDAVYTQHWRPLEQLLGDALEELVRDDVQAAGRFVKRNEVYRTHVAELEAHADQPGYLDFLENRVKELRRRGRYYRAFLWPGDVEMASALGLLEAERRHLGFLRSWGAGTAYPLLLRIYDRVDAGQVQHEEAAHCLEYLESFLVRRHLAGVPTNVLNRLFLGLIDALPEAEPVDEALRLELSRDGRWPSDEQVRDGVLTKQFYGRGRPNQQKLVLERLEAYLRAEVEVDFDASALSIEHVLPQTMSPEWRQRLQEDGDDPDGLFARWGHALGNLTLTAFNSQLSNSLIERKQEILSDSELRLNEPIVDVDRWGVAEIEARAGWLARIAIECWSPPIPGIITPPSGFDWSPIDQAVAAIPMGRWTSYGDLAELGGTAAMPTAQHLASHDGPEKGHRVLGGDGAVRPGFAWTDPHDDRDPVEVLTGEGVEFDSDGKANQAQRLRVADLLSLLGEDSDDE
jgi:alkylated DNA nucleotide flippase Atl1